MSYINTTTNTEFLARLDEYIEMLNTHLSLECEKSNRYHREGPGRSVDRAAIADRRIENLRALLVSLGELPKSALRSEHHYLNMTTTETTIDSLVES